MKSTPSGPWPTSPTSYSVPATPRASELFKFWDRLKDFITNRTLNYEQKNKDPIVVSNMVNLLFTSNNENALKIFPNDRRSSLGSPEK
jgi:hypothetical protein